MESNDKLKETDIKNRTCYYFYDIMKVEDMEFDNISLVKKVIINIVLFTFCNNQN